MFRPNVTNMREVIFKNALLASDLGSGIKVLHHATTTDPKVFASGLYALGGLTNKNLNATDLKGGLTPKNISGDALGGQSTLNKDDLAIAVVTSDTTRL